VCPEKYSQEKVRESWYGKPDSLLGQTFQKNKRQAKKKQKI
jgi:hypothetical protein